MLKPKEYSKEENWKVFTSWIPDRKSDNYKYLVEQRPISSRTLVLRKSICSWRDCSIGTFCLMLQPTRTTMPWTWHIVK